jgi:hypothetical protein
MAVTAESILDRVRTQLIDTNVEQRWSDEELLRWLSDGQRALVSFIPDASSTIAVRPLAAGTRQSIPSDGHMLLTIFRNTNAGGTTGGRAVRVASRELLDGFDPAWHSASATVNVQAYIFDPQHPDVFYVYPPNTGAGYVELSYSVMPEDLASTSDTLTVSDIYQTPLVDYVLYRAHQKDGDFAAGQAIASNYLQLFLAHIGQGQAAELSNNPNLQLADPNPSAKGTAR